MRTALAVVLIGVTAPFYLQSNDISAVGCTVLQMLIGKRTWEHIYHLDCDILDLVEEMEPDIDKFSKCCIGFSRLLTRQEEVHSGKASKTCFFCKGLQLIYSYFV